MASRPTSYGPFGVPPALEGAGESELWRGFRGFRRFRRPRRFGRFFGRRWGRPWGGGGFFPPLALPAAAPAVAAADAGDPGDSSDGDSEHEVLQAEVMPENETESEYWRRYRLFRRGRFRRFGRPFRRRRFWRWRRRFGGFQPSGGGFAQSDEPDTTDTGDSGDDGDQGELEFQGEAPGETESEVRRVYRYGGYRYPAYRYRAAVRPYRYGALWRRRYPYYGRTFARRYPYLGRTYYRGRYWPVRRYWGGRFYSPLAYRRWPWLYRRYGYRPPMFAGAVAPALPPVPVGPPLPPAPVGPPPSAPLVDVGTAGSP